MKQKTNRIVMSFVFYGLLGWVVETAFIYFSIHRYIERGWVHYGLPLIPLYGVMCPVLIKLLRPLKKKPALIFACSACIITLVEYVMGSILTFHFGYNFWNYSNLPFSYKGIVALPVTFSWGFLSLLLIYWIDPRLKKLIRRLPEAPAAVLSLCIALYSVVCSAIFMDKYFF
jgi:uncharacterized membrane protein